MSLKIILVDREPIGFFIRSQFTPKFNSSTQEDTGREETLLNLLAAVFVRLWKHSANPYPQKCLYYLCRVYVVYPDEFHNGLWGGEGVVKGMLKRQAQRKRKKL
jgi:hypothetical protein